MELSDEITARIMAMLHRRSAGLAPGDPVPEPLISASAFHLPGDDPDPGRIYGRMSGPTIEAAEARIESLEGAPTCLFPSGMAAYGGVLLSVLRSGDHILMLEDGYYTVRGLVEDILGPLGVTVSYVPATEVEAADLSGTRMVIIETPTNPMLHVIDIAALAARCRDAGCMLVVDNSVPTPVLQQPLDLGADVVLAADTKAMGGHTDILLGHVATHDAALLEKIRTTRKLGGAIPGAFEAWLLVRGLETLELRLSRMCANAKAVADLLRDHPRVSDVRYPDPSPQMPDPGFLVGASFASKAEAERFVEATGALIPMTSFGGVHSSADRRARWGDDVPEGFLRLSMGCEPTSPLLAAIAKGLATL